MECLGIVRKLFDELNNSVKYCHWKSNQHFQDALIGVDDLDILIDRSEYGKLQEILHKLNFKHFYTPKSRTYVAIEDYLGFDEETGKIIHLHLHSQLIVGEKHLKGFHIPMEKEVLRNRRFDEETKCYLSSYFDELLLLILRAGMKNRTRDVFKKNVVEKNTIQEFLWLKERCIDFEEKLKEQSFLSDRIRIILIQVYNQGFDWKTMKKLKDYLYRDLSYFSQGSSFHNTTKRHRNEFCRIILEIKKRYLPSKYSFLRRRPATGGVTIAFLGSDGAGKSSAIKEIRQWLLKVMDVRYFYMGSGDGHSSMIRKPLKIMKCIGQKLGLIKITNNYTDSSLRSDTKVSKKMNFARKLWIYTLSKERIQKLCDANRCRSRGFIVLTDRYPQSEFDGLCDGPKLRGKKGLASSKEDKSFNIASLCPPDLAIKLIVSPEEAQKRKPGEIDLETSRNLTERVKHIKFSEHTKSVMIDSDQPQEQVILEIKRAIWEAI